MHAPLQPAAVVVYEQASLKASRSEAYPFAPRVSVQYWVVMKKEMNAVDWYSIVELEGFLLALLLFSTE